MIELLLTKKTNVYSYGNTSSGQNFIGSLIRVDNERGFSLDLFENETIPISYEIADVKDPSVKLSPFSKNFRIPGTKRNQLAMEYAYMFSSDYFFKVYNGVIVGGNEWQINIEEAAIYVDGILAFTGKLELTKAIVAQGEVNSFEVNFLATQINIFDELENKNMRDLELPNDLINDGTDILNMFRTTAASDTFTLNGTTRSGFTLAYPDWGFESGATAGGTASVAGKYATTDVTTVFTSTATPDSDPTQIGLQAGFNFTRYAYVKYLVDTIFDGIDISYQSDFFESEAFQKLLLLCYDSSELPSNTGMRIFGSNPSATSYYSDAISFGSPFQPDISTNTMENFSAVGTVPLASPFNAGESLKDPFVFFDPGTQRLIFKRTGTFNLQIKAVIDIRFGWDMVYLGQGNYCPPGFDTNIYNWATYPLLGPNSNIQVQCENRTGTYTVSIAGKTMTSTSLATPNTYTKGSGTHYQWESSHNAYTVPLNLTISALEGDIWKFVVNADLTNYKAAPVQVGCTAFPVDERKYQVALDILAVDSSPFYFNWNQTLPDISQKDFIVALIRHFNIYSEVTPNSRIISMEPRDNFYGSGFIQDWTLKLDLSSVREIQRTDPPVEVFARMKRTDNVIDKAAQDTNTNQLEYGSYQEFLTNGKEQVVTIQSDFGSTTPNYMQTWDLISFRRQFVQTTDTINGEVYTWNIPNPALFSTDNEGVRQLTEESSMFLGYRPDFVVPIDGANKDPLFAHYFVPGVTGVTGTLVSATGGRIADHLWTISSLGASGSDPVDVNFSGTQTAWLSGGNVPPALLNYDTNNTPEVIDRNEFRGDIYIKPARSINFIQLNFVAVRTGVEFEEIVGRF